MNESHTRRRLKSKSSHRLIPVTGLAFVVIAAFSAPNPGDASAQAGNSPTQQPSPTPSPADVRTLSPNEFSSRHIEFGQTHVYEMRLEQGQFVRISVEQRGVDLELKATGPAGFSIRVDSPNGFFGPETVSLPATSGGTYSLAVAYSSTAQYPPGDYDLKVSDARAMTADDEIRISAERVFAEAQTLRRDRTTLTESIDKYLQAIKLWRKVGNLRDQGYSLINIARVQRLQRQLTPALESLKEARALLQQAGDPYGQAFAFNESGNAHRELGSLREAIVLYEAALKIRNDRGDRFGQAQVYTNIGLTYSYIGYQPRSLENHEKALAIWRELGVRHQEMRTLINAAKAHVEMGDLGVSRSLYQMVLDYCNRELAKEKSPLADNARDLKPFALNGLGLVYDTWSDTDSALTYYEEALSLFSKRNDPTSEGDVLDNIGMVYAFLGDPFQAIEFFQRALILRERSGEPRPWGMTLSNLGYAHTLLKNYKEAQRRLSEALPLSGSARDRRFEAYTLTRLGMTYVAQNEPLKALEYYEKALAIQQEPSFEDRRGQAITLDKIAESLMRSGQPAEAIKKYENAIELWRSVGDGQGQALSLYGIARIESEQLNLANARDRVEEAIGIVEKLRNRVTGRQLQMTYFAGKQDLYALAIDVRILLYDAKRSPVDLEAALVFSEKARARNLLDLLTEARVDLYQGMSPQVAEQNRRLDRQISELTQSLVRFRGVDAKQDVASIQRTLNAHINEQERLLASLKRRIARTPQAQPLSPREIRQLLDDDTVLLQYSLSQKRSHLWAVTRTDIKYYSLPAQAEIENTANQLRQALRDQEPAKARTSDVEVVNRRRSASARFRQSANELSRLILSDVAAQLGKKRIVIVADGALQYVPFEALPLPDNGVATQPAARASQQPMLLLDHEIVYQPSASALASLRRTRRPITSKTVAVLADPVFKPEDNTDSFGNNKGKPAYEKLTRALRDIGDDSQDFTLPPLEFSLKEANAITATAPRGSWLKAVRFKANRALATSPLLKQFSIVHFATHGILNEKNPELSGIVLSMINQRGQPEDGYLTLREIYGLDLPVHLVVVSACETGVGKPVRGEGVIALTRGFMNAGAQSVIVSLWRVDDEATAELMKRFYAHMFGKGKLSPAAALRQAKIEMNDYLPYFWAGFVLQGDWK